MSGAASAGSPAKKVKKQATKVDEYALANGHEIKQTYSGITTSGVDAMGLLDHLENKKKATKKDAAVVQKQIRNARKVVSRMKSKASSLSNKELLEEMHMRMDKQKKDLEKSSASSSPPASAIHEANPEE